ncbi:MAG: hypothetical protein Kapaf2KO_11560 [Candidatus Kapaibacteriales bacterium]
MASQKAKFVGGMIVLLIAVVSIVLIGMGSENENYTTIGDDVEGYDTDDITSTDLIAGTGEKRFLTQEEFKKMQQAKVEMTLIDVREPSELEGGYILGMYNVPTSELEDSKLNTFLQDIKKDDKLVLYCKSGGRSERMMEKLLEEGYTDVYSLNGGYSNYK